MREHIRLKFKDKDYSLDIKQLTVLVGDEIDIQIVTNMVQAMREIMTSLSIIEYLNSENKEISSQGLTSLVEDIISDNVNYLMSSIGTCEVWYEFGESEVQVAYQVRYGVIKLYKISYKVDSSEDYFGVEKFYNLYEMEDSKRYDPKEENDMFDAVCVCVTDINSTEIIEHFKNFYSGYLIEFIESNFSYQKQIAGFKEVMESYFKNENPDYKGIPRVLITTQSPYILCQVKEIGLLPEEEIKIYEIYKDHIIGTEERMDPNKERIMNCVLKNFINNGLL